MDAFTPAAAKAARLKQILTSQDLRFIMEAHDGMSAKIVQDAGFEAIWASGLSISTALGVRDNNELSWTQVLDQLEYMADATRIPILVDGDTGYGNFNNFRRFVTKLCERGIGGVCIEDKVFPKTNSFLGEDQTLASIDEFCGKIKAGKDTQRHDGFCIVARVEALISGLGMEEALKRAHRYVDAGADAIVIHSKKRDPDEVMDFLRHWDNRAPVVLIPTKYYRTPTDRFREAGVSTVIWANHNMRAAISAMRDTSARIFADQHLRGVEDAVTPLDQVFALTGAEELEEAEKRYLASGPDRRAVILAASRGEALADLTEDKPKCMLNVRGKTILQRQVDAFARHGLRDILAVTGYRADTVVADGATLLPNPDFADTGEARSLAQAGDALNGAALISYGDIVFQPFFVDVLTAQDDDICLLVDPAWADRTEGQQPDTDDLVRCTFGPDDMADSADAAFLTEIRADLPEAHGKWIGMMGLSDTGSARMRAALEALDASGRLDQADLAEVLRNIVAAGHPVRVIYVAGNWQNVNDLADLARARNEM